MVGSATLAMAPSSTAMIRPSAMVRMAQYRSGIGSPSEVSMRCRCLPVLRRMVAETAGQMVIHHAGRLHEGVADRRANEAEAALLQVAAHPVGNLGSRRH